MPSIGTRVRQNFRQEHPASRLLSAGYTRDLGMKKNVTAAMTFVAASGQVQAAATTFANFAVGDVVMITGAVLNSGSDRLVVATDASTFLQLDAGVQNEGPITATIRTI